MSEYPQCEKISALSSERRIVMEFLEWLESEGSGLCLCNEVDGDFFSCSATSESIAHRFLGIDRDALEKERRAMLKKARNV